ncbi:MAG: cation:proton antiporter [Deltaproteobacteria bacterium]|nr:MAG: cation:proton antiporter [Deltaproteobacteria bacterium]
MEYLIYIFLVVGLIFNCLGSIGLLRFPDVYTRLHAATKCTTFGSIFICLAVALYGLVFWYNGDAGYSGLTIHTLIALAALLATNPTGAHAIARAAHRSGIKPKYAVVDKLSEAELK